MVLSRIKQEEKIEVLPNRFAAIDFETANFRHNSACSIGIVIVEDFKIVERKYWLIKPPEMYFHPFNISIHGITADDVKDEPDFSELWPRISRYINNNLIVAHNASFDISVLRHVLDEYGLEYPESHYACTLYISRRLFKGLKSHCLRSVSDFLGIQFNHHHALEDAEACAMIAVNACRAAEANNLFELSQKIDMVCGYIRPRQYNPVNYLSSLRGHFSGITAISPQFETADCSHPFYKKVLVFTGTLLSMGRKEAVLKAVNAGGICTDKVTMNIDFLVVGNQDAARLRGNHESSKERKARELILQGFEIEILKEEEFLKLL